MRKVGRFQWCHKSSKKRRPHIIPLWSLLSSGSSAFLTVTLLQEGFSPPPSGHKIRRVMLRSIYIGLILQEHFIIFSIFFVGGAELSLSLLSWRADKRALVFPSTGRARNEIPEFSSCGSQQTKRGFNFIHWKSLWHLVVGTWWVCVEAVTSRSRNGWQVKFGKLVPIWSVFPPTQRWVKVIEYISMCVYVEHVQMLWGKFV